MGIPSFQQKVPDLMLQLALWPNNGGWIINKVIIFFLYYSSSWVLTSWIMSIRQFPVFTKRNSKDISLIIIFLLVKEKVKCSSSFRLILYSYSWTESVGVVVGVTPNDCNHPCSHRFLCVMTCGHGWYGDYFGGGESCVSIGFSCLLF
jgi:hypothetical protein